MFSLYKRIGVTMNGRIITFPTPFGVFTFLFVLSFLWTTWFTVGKGEQAVKFTLGAYSGSYSPGGPYFKLPWPFEDFEKVDVQHIVEVPIGYRHDSKGAPIDVPEESETLTGDANTVMIDSTLQFQRSDAKKWLLIAQEPERVLKLLAQSALRSATAERTFDQILTTERTAAQAGSEKRIRDSLETVGISATVVAHQIQDTQPPAPVKAAFADVTNALEEKNKKTHEANGYLGEMRQAARGEAQKLLEGAVGYKNRRVNEARGEADRFDLIYAQYKNAPDLTRDRMRFEALEAVLPGKMQIIDKSGSQSNSPLLKFVDIGAMVHKKQQESK